MSNSRNIVQSSILAALGVLIIMFGCTKSAKQFVYNDYFENAEISKRYLLQVTETTRITKTDEKPLSPSIVTPAYDLIISATDMQDNSKVELKVETSKIKGILPLEKGTVLGAIATKDKKTIGKLVARPSGASDDLEEWLKSL